MSSGLDTATRRKVRKAFGAEALDIIAAHEQGLVGHAQSIKLLEKRVGDERKERITVCGALQTFANSAHARLDTADELRLLHVEGWRRRGLFGRLRWLLRGK